MPDASPGSATEPPARRPRLLVLIGSSRRGGNTETLTDVALAALPVPAEVDRVRLIDLDIKPIVDLRHAGVPFPDYGDDYDGVLFRMLGADVVVFSAPVYWYSMPGPMKNFLDRWSVSLRDTRFDFRARMREKAMYVVTVVSDDREVARPLIDAFRLTCDYLGMAWGGAAVGYGNRPGDVLGDAAGLAEARRLFGNLPEVLAGRGRGAGTLLDRRG